MKVGAEDKNKLILLAALTVVAAVTVYVQFFSGSGGSSALVNPPRPQPTAATPKVEATAPRQLPPPSQRRSSSSARRRGGEFEPVWRRSHEDEAFDPLEVDPTLRTDLLAAVRDVEFNGVERNIFLFGERKREAPPPPTADEITEAQRLQEQAAARQPETAPEPRPEPARRAPRLTWKYYGFAAPAGNSARRAFLLDGEDVLIGGEGAVFKSRYEITRIGLTSITIKDREFDEEQTLPITTPRG